VPENRDLSSLRWPQDREAIVAELARRFPIPDPTPASIAFLVRVIRGHYEAEIRSEASNGNGRSRRDSGRHSTLEDPASPNNEIDRGER
jgi:hypothetical protein